MSFGMGRTAVASGTALLICLGTIGTAAADEEPPAPTAPGPEQAVETGDGVAQDDTDINDRADWESDEPGGVVNPRYCDGPQTWIEITSKKNYQRGVLVERHEVQGRPRRQHDRQCHQSRHHLHGDLGRRRG
ncbi:hypothetical protein ACWEHT_17910 [Streptomyces sp. NPDC004646]